MQSAILALALFALASADPNCTALSAYNTPDNFCTGVPNLMIYPPLSASQQDCAASAWFNATWALSSNRSLSVAKELQNVACKLFFPPCYLFSFANVSHQSFMQPCQITCQRVAGYTGISASSPLLSCDNSTYWVQPSVTNQTACCVDPQVRLYPTGQIYYTDVQEGNPSSDCFPLNPAWTPPPLPDIGVSCSAIAGTFSTASASTTASSIGTTTSSAGRPIAFDAFLVFAFVYIFVRLTH